MQGLGLPYGVVTTDERSLTKAAVTAWMSRVFPSHVLFGAPSFFRVSLVAQLVKNLPAIWETWVQSLHWEDPLEKGMATHSSILAWRISWNSLQAWSSGAWYPELQSWPFSFTKELLYNKLYWGGNCVNQRFFFLSYLEYHTFSMVRLYSIQHWQGKKSYRLVDQIMQYSLDMFF